MEKNGLEEKIEGAKNLKILLHLVPAIFFIFYSLGFISWNMFLSSYGFFEYNLLQTRYLSSGILIFFFLFITACILHFFILKYLKVSKVRKIIIFIIITVAVFFIFNRYLFYIVPSHFGGAKPPVISVIGSPDQIDFLSNFDIVAADNAEGRFRVQTFPLCKIYENDSVLILGVTESNQGAISDHPKRVIILHSNEIKGTSIIPAYKKGEKVVCDNFSPSKFFNF